MKDNQSLSNLISSILHEVDKIFEVNIFKYVIIQGDTATSFAVSLSAFFHKITIIHIEAGLRTYNKYEPFPEEINRKLISNLADYHFTPTVNAYNNLLSENIKKNIHCVGNTIIDMLRLINIEIIHPNNANKIIITLHRRENQAYFIDLFKQINNIAMKYNTFEYIVIKHHSISDNIYYKYLIQSNIKIIDSLPYLDFIKLLAQSKFIISDSGGIQEEITFLKKKILICRNVTERDEIITLGFGKLVGHNISDNIEWAIDYNCNLNYINPYGDGYASKKIIDILEIA
jgi:UDP-N-acetylglucosamine 2-epimerase (non-hydrolysing)